MLSHCIGFGSFCCKRYKSISKSISVFNSTYGDYMRTKKNSFSMNFNSKAMEMALNAIINCPTFSVILYCQIIVVCLKKCFFISVHCNSHGCVLIVIVVC